MLAFPPLPQERWCLSINVRYIESSDQVGVGETWVFLLDMHCLKSSFGEEGEECTRHRRGGDWAETIVDPRCHLELRAMFFSLLNS